MNLSASAADRPCPHIHNTWARVRRSATRGRRRGNFLFRKVTSRNSAILSMYPARIPGPKAALSSTVTAGSRGPEASRKIDASRAAQLRRLRIACESVRQPSASCGLSLFFRKQVRRNAVGGGSRASEAARAPSLFLSVIPHGLHDVDDAGSVSTPVQIGSTAIPLPPPLLSSKTAAAAANRCGTLREREREKKKIRTETESDERRAARRPFLNV